MRKYVWVLLWSWRVRSCVGKVGVSWSCSLGNGWAGCSFRNWGVCAGSGFACCCLFYHCRWFGSIHLYKKGIYKSLLRTQSCMQSKFREERRGEHGFFALPRHWNESSCGVDRVCRLVAEPFSVSRIVAWFEIWGS